MTDIDWWEKAESLRDRYPEVNVADAFPKVVDAYVTGQPGKTQELPFEFVVDALILFRYAAGLTPTAPGEQEVESEKQTPTHALVEARVENAASVATSQIEDADLSNRKGCLSFFKK